MTAPVAPVDRKEEIRKFLCDLREPRRGIHENGEEELKTWDELYQQCEKAAALLARAYGLPDA